MQQGSICVHPDNWFLLKSILSRFSSRGQIFIPTRHWRSSFLHLCHVLCMSEVFCYVIINVSLPFSFQQILSDFGKMAVKRKIHPRVHLSLQQMGWDGIGNLQHPNYYFACFFLLLFCQLCSGLVSEIDLNSRVDFSFQPHKMTQ